MSLLACRNRFVLSAIAPQQVVSVQINETTGGDKFCDVVMGSRVGNYSVECWVRGPFQRLLAGRVLVVGRRQQSSRWSLHGVRSGLLQVLGWAWERWLRERDLTLDDCPVVLT